MKKDINTLCSILKSGNKIVNDNDDGQTVSVAEFEKVKKENDKLKYRIETLKRVNIIKVSLIFFFPLGIRLQWILLENWTKGNILFVDA